MAIQISPVQLLRANGAGDGHAVRDRDTAVHDPGHVAARSADVDTVTLSEASARVSRAGESGGSTTVDDARVRELRAAIIEGRYAPDARQLAERLLVLEQSLKPRRDD
jgi:negative regulator of flagellin synthesis FlgM